MLLRKILLAAFVAAPLALSPANVSAQARGLDRAAEVTAHADAMSGKSQATKKAKDMPPGIARRFEGETLPPGIRRTREAPAPPADLPPEPEPEPEPDECGWELVYVNGMPMLQDCNGNVVPIGGTL